MTDTPTLQGLAVYARDHFGEDGYPFEASLPSSFDTVVAAYARQADQEEAQRRANTLLQDWLRSRGSDADQPDVAEFVSLAMAYLRSQYPEATEVQKEQQMLTHLFWGNLVEARYATGGADHTGWVARFEERTARHLVTV